MRRFLKGCSSNAVSIASYSTRISRPSHGPTTPSIKEPITVEPPKLSTWQAPPPGLQSLDFDGSSLCVKNRDGSLYYKSGIGYVRRDCFGNRIVCKAKQIRGVVSHLSELQACKESLADAVKDGVKKLEARLDCEHVASALDTIVHGAPQKVTFTPLHYEIAGLIKEFTYFNHRRAKESELNVADNLSKRGRNGSNTIWGIGKSVPEEIQRELEDDNISAGICHSLVPGITDLGISPREIKKVGIVGGGLCGAGIATVLALRGIVVLLKEQSCEALELSLNMINENLRSRVRKGKMQEYTANKAMTMVKGTLDYQDLSDVDMVIEAVDEDVKLKRSIFKDIDKVCRRDCILASTTSTIELEALGQDIDANERIIGTHFFSPAHLVPFLEIVRSDKTSPQVVCDVMAFAKVLKKECIVVQSNRGFAVTRSFFQYIQASHLLAHLGTDVFRIDEVLTEFGMPIGPFGLQDLIGCDVALAISTSLYSSGYYTFQSPLLDLLVKDGRKGKKNGRGFYVYPKGLEPVPDTSFLQILDKSRSLLDMKHDGQLLTDDQILEMILFPVINEACRVIDDGIVIRPWDLNIASVLAMSFPMYTGGILRWADTKGAGYILTCLHDWSQRYGMVFEPSNHLQNCVMNNVPLSMISYGSSQS